MESCSNQISVKQIKISFIYFKVATLCLDDSLAFSQPSGYSSSIMAYVQKRTCCMTMWLFVQSIVAVLCLHMQTILIFWQIRSPLKKIWNEEILCDWSKDQLVEKYQIWPACVNAAVLAWIKYSQILSSIGAALDPHCHLVATFFTWPAVLLLT